jgi:hypothetical protein
LQLNEVEELLQAHNEELSEELDQLIVADKEKKKKKKVIMKIKQMNKD